MRIGPIEFVATSIPRKERFTIARSSSDVADNVLVVVHADDFLGQGSAAPNDVTRETLKTVTEALRALAGGLEGFDFASPVDVARRMDAIVPVNPSAKAAVDIAVHDIVAQEAGMPLYKFLGGSRDRMATDRTIGIMSTDDAVERARRWSQEGFRALKVKVGVDPSEDLRRLRAIRAAVGSHVELRVDGNQGYSWAQALTFARAAKDLGVAFFEQPVPVTDWEGMRVLAESSPIPIMADEMVLTAEDAKKLRWANAAQAVNLKLMKHGGIVRAAEVNAICESAGYPTMVGCMGEPELSVAAGLHLALAQKNVQWIDLDSHFSLDGDPTSGLRFEGGELIAPDKPGLGIDVDWSAIS